MVGPDVISVSSNPQAQKILKRVEREATHRYQTLTLPEDGASNLFIVNGTLIHRCKSEAPKSDAVSIIFLETNGFLKTYNNMMWIRYYFYTHLNMSYVAF